MWLTVAQLAGLLNISKQATQKALQNGKYALVRQVDGQRARGGKVWEISAHDPAIPAEIRQQLGIEATKQELLQKTLKEAERMSITSETLHDKTAQRLRVLRLVSEKPDGIITRDWYKKIASDEGISSATIYRWIAEADRGKIASDRAPIPVAIAAQSGPIKVEVKSRSFAPQALEYGLSLLIRNPMMDISRAFSELTVEAAVKGWELGSIGSFYRAVNQLPEFVSVLASSGRRGAEAIIKPAMRRDMDFVNVYDILIGDQHIFDYTVFDDDGAPIRPQMFAWVDSKSRYFSGLWPVMGNYDQYAVGFALREACRWGIPKSLYNDWGKPEGAKYIEQLRRQLNGLSAFKTRSGEDIEPLKQTKAKPRNAQAKAIESYFYHAVENPLKQLALPGYSRRDIDEKKNEFIQEKLRQEIKGKKLLHAKAFFEIVTDIFQQWHSHTMTEDKTIPEDVFLDAMTRTPLRRFDDQTLDFLFWPAATLMVRNSKVAMTLAGFGKCEWHAPELVSLCHRGKKEKVEVRFNPYDASTVYVLDLETHKQICIAERWEKSNPFDKAEVSDKVRRQNQLLRYVIDINKQLAKPEIKIHQLSPYEAAAAEIVSIEKGKEELVVNRAEIDRKIISLSKQLDKEAMLKKAEGKLAKAH